MTARKFLLIVASFVTLSISFDSLLAAQTEIPKAKKAFEESLAQWKEASKTASRAKLEFMVCEKEKAHEYREVFRRAVDEGNLYRDQTVDKAIALYRLSPSQEIGTLIADMISFDFENGRYERNYHMCVKMLEIEPENPSLQNSLIEVCLKTDRYEEARDLLTDIASKNPDVELNMKKINDAVEFWGLEKSIRDAETKADDLPRVELKTSKGTIVVELYENEAPDTVANFIHLVEDKFYDGKKFHRVMAGFMAQTGCPLGNGAGDAGYEIYDEHNRRDARLHYRGVLSMANDGKNANNQSSQFFITFTSTSYLNGKHTVFGRVIKGFDVLERIAVTHKTDPKENNKEKPIDGVVPDTIVTATVLRKRDHEYKPNKVVK